MAGFEDALLELSQHFTEKSLLTTIARKLKIKNADAVVNEKIKNAGDDCKMAAYEVFKKWLHAQAKPDEAKLRAAFESMELSGIYSMVMDTPEHAHLVSNAPAGQQAALSHGHPPAHYPVQTAVSSTDKMAAVNLGLLMSELADKVTETATLHKLALQLRVSDQVNAIVADNKDSCAMRALKVMQVWKEQHAEHMGQPKTDAQYTEELKQAFTNIKKAGIFYDALKAVGSQQGLSGSAAASTAMDAAAPGAPPVASADKSTPRGQSGQQAAKPSPVDNVSEEEEEEEDEDEGVNEDEGEGDSWIGAKLNKMKKKKITSVTGASSRQRPFPLAPDGPESYKLKEKLGRLLIINIEEFRGELKKREGTVEDQKKIIDVTEMMGITVGDRIVLDDNKKLTANKIRTTLKEAAEKSYSDYSCFCCFVMSHGNNKHNDKGNDRSYFFTYDECKITIEELTGYFQDPTCDEYLRKIPKLFFIQACRGGKDDHGVENEGDSSPSDSSGVDPTHADTFIFQASMPGYRSYRNSQNGSNFMQCLCTALEKHYKEKEIMEIGMMVNSMVSKWTPNVNGAGECKQMSVMTSTLRKKFFFADPNKKEQK